MTYLAVVKRVVPFCFALAAGLGAVWLVTWGPSEREQLRLAGVEEVRVPTFGDRYAPHCRARWAETSSLRILSKSRPEYTPEARENNVQGTVVLRVVFKSDGTIGAVEPVKELEGGLTDQAVAAAWRIAFEPARENGRPITVTKQIEYTFSIY